jgi:hypothetical protein
MVKRTRGCKKFVMKTFITVTLNQIRLKVKVKGKVVPVL